LKWVRASHPSNDTPAQGASLGSCHPASSGVSEAQHREVEGPPGTRSMPKPRQGVLPRTGKQ
jgi:hypothetical protein